MFEKLQQKLISAEPKCAESFSEFITELKDMLQSVLGLYSKEEIVKQLLFIRSITSYSPLLYRAQTWPRGYQGDFETIDHIISQQNKANPETIGYLFEDYFLKSDICQQHINKIKHQSALIAKCIARNPQAKILSIGCGTSEDLSLNLSALQENSVSITLVDVDVDALNYSVSRLSSIKDRVKTIPGNIYKISMNLQETYDLIIIGGVFDYLSDKVIIKILSSLKMKVNKRGVLFFTNIKSNNPFKIYMEYLLDWVLIERSAAQIQNILVETGCDDFDIRFNTDDTGLTFMVDLNAK